MYEKNRQKEVIEMLKALTLMIAIFSSVTVANANKLEAFDVSILFPLPAARQWDGLISPATQPNMLPWPVFEKVAFFINQPNDRTYPNLRVVGIRLDPCFHEGPPPLRCQHQVRFIWQPLKLENGQTSTVDASLHSFFHLSKSEFEQLIVQLENLQLRHTLDHSKFRMKPLSVHPLLNKYGLNSSYALELKSIILKAVESKSIARVTFMKLKGVDDIWIFGGFDLDPTTGDTRDILIPRLRLKTSQEFINSLAMRKSPRQFLGGIFPAPEESALDDLIDQITKDSNDLDSYREQDIKAMIGQIADFENPSKHNPGTLDCVSCHLTNTLRAWSNINFSRFPLKQEYERHRFQSNSINLNNISPLQGQTDVLRMFGYFERNPIVAQRTINETAEVISALRLRDETSMH